MVLVVLISLVAALIDVLGVGSLAPFLSVAANPGIVQTNPWLKGLYEVLGFVAVRDFLIALGLAVLAFVVTTNVFKALTRYAVVRFTSMARHRLSVALMQGYLRQSYPFFLRRNSHEFVKNVNNEIQSMIQGTLLSFIDALGATLQLVLFIAFLVYLNPLITVVIALVVGTIYGALYLGLRGLIKRLGQNRFELNAERNRVVSETFWGIKDTKVLGVEASFLKQYETPSFRFAKNESQAEVVGDVPKFALEAIAFGTILLFVLWIVIQTGSFQDAAVTVGVFAFASYRMIPAVQNLFKALTKLRYSEATAHRMCDEFATLQDGPPVSLAKGPQAPMSFRDSVELRGIEFSYPLGDRPVLRNLNLAIPHRKTIGFVGSTGSGKTTTIDLILGLLSPTSGQILIDGVPLAPSNLRSWQANIGYVPQSIYLSNASIAQNIAFGVAASEIDLERVEEAARLAQIHEFIENELPSKYQTEVGERGVRLSGGQRQRLGIARALYRKPEVLVFDEATSALDSETEAALMDSVAALSGSMTLIMIAHRISTLKACDIIYQLEGGFVAKQGTYQELFVSSDTGGTLP